MRTLNRRDFLKMTAFSSVTTLLSYKNILAGDINKPVQSPNILLILTDQQSLNTISALGCKDVSTPNLDQLAKRGTSFLQSYCTYPVCGPARSSIFTGRMPCETGVVENGYKIRYGMANLGQLLKNAGYETTYCGKWHLPFSWQRNIQGFDVIPAGLCQGTLGDAVVSRGCQGYLHNRSKNKPFFLVASFLQSHDICEWIRMNQSGSDEKAIELTKNDLPDLPRNFDSRIKEPAAVRGKRSAQVVTLDGYKGLQWSRLQWRYYLWNYYRMVEEVDAEIGRVLDAVELSGYSDNTVIIFTSDHGEGMGGHGMTVKGFFYEEAVKVPLIISSPKIIPEDVIEKETLVSGLDIFSTVCDFAKVAIPENTRGISLKSVIEKKTAGHEFVISEVGANSKGWMLRSSQYKYICYGGNQIEQFFDLKNDPFEKKNLFDIAEYEKELNKHRKLLAQYRNNLDVAPKQDRKYKSWSDRQSWCPS